MKKTINKIATLTLILIMSIPSLMAQQEVKGVVVDQNGNALEYVNVVAMQLPDSIFINGVITDKSGTFRFDGLPSESLLVFSSIGYQKQVHPATLHMQITLHEEATILSEVSVVARKLTLRPRGYTMNLDNIPLTKGKNILQTLEMLPNINVDNGQISILSRGVEAIYLDGQRLHDTKDLDAIPTEQISHIEVDYTSSVREGASSSGGVLHIYLKKQSNGGWSGNIGTFTEYMPHYGWRGGGVNNYFSARWEKLTIRNSINVNKVLYLGDERITTLDKVTNTKQQSLNKLRNWETFISNRLSLSYNITPKHFIATSLLYRYILGQPTDATTNLIDDSESYQLRKNPSHILQWVTNYKWSISPTSSLELSSDLLHRQSDQRTIEQRPQFYDAQVKQNTQMTRIRGEFKHTFNDVGTLSVGTDLQWIKQNENSTQVVPTAMQTNTPSLFTTFGGQVGFFQYETGLRLQHNDTQTTQEGAVFRHKYTGVFPSLSAMYLISPKHGHLVNLQIERLLETIPYSAISGYKQYSGPYDYTVGNPDLKTPIGTQAIALISLWGKLNITLGGIYHQNPIYFARKVDKQDARTTYTMPMNGRYQLLLISNVEWRQKMTKWWDTKTSALVRINSADAGVVVKNQASVLLRHNSDFAITPDFGAGLRLYYEPTYRYLDRKMISVGHVSGNLYKTFLKGDLDLRLDFVLFGKQRTSITENERVTYKYENLSHSPSLTLTVKYRFGGGKKVKSLANTTELQQYETTVDMK